MKKILAVIALSTFGLHNAKAATIDLTSLTVDYAVATASFLGGGVSLNVVSLGNILGDYTSDITATSLDGATQTLYTAATNQNPDPDGNGLIPMGGLGLPGGPAPTGTMDDVTNIIEVDMSSLFADHGPMDQNVGGLARGFINPNTNRYQMSWVTVLTQGPAAGNFVTFTFAGLASVDTGGAVVPVPAAAWLFASGLIGLVGVARKKAA